MLNGKTGILVFTVLAILGAAAMSHAEPAKLGQLGSGWPPPKF